MFVLAMAIYRQHVCAAVVRPNRARCRGNPNFVPPSESMFLEMSAVKFAQVIMFYAHTKSNQSSTNVLQQSQQHVSSLLQL